MSGQGENYTLLFGDDIGKVIDGFKEQIEPQLRGWLEKNDNNATIDIDYTQSFTDYEDFFLSKEYDIIITDLNYEFSHETGRSKSDKEMDGIAILIKNKERHPEYKTAGILVTAYDDLIKGKKGLEKAHKAGITYPYIIKKGKAEDISEKVCKQLLETIKYVLDNIVKPFRQIRKDIDKRLAPQPYEVTILKGQLFEDKMGLFIKKKDIKYQMALLLHKSQAVTFNTIFKHGRSPITLRNIVNKIQNEKIQCISPLNMSNKKNIIERFKIDLAKENPMCLLSNDNLCGFALQNKALGHLKTGETGYQCANLAEFCVKQLRFIDDEYPGKDFTKDKIKNHVEDIRKDIDEKGKLILQLFPEISQKAVLCEHQNMPKIFCGKCFLYRWRSGGGGYAICASLDKEIESEDVEKDFQILKKDNGNCI
ncbi:MAG: hypothetical protein K8T10_15840 [Candidatus Eremiobacteraeota bacterium]|nr:hypothetical protein [Candidatus Eremiobacteraeota bacterium]